MTKLVFENVSFSHGEAGVENISFASNDGAIVAIVGASGSGKSTILNLIAGFLQPDQGEIFLNDTLVSSPHKLVPPAKRSVGLVFQNHALLPHKTVRANIEFGCQNKAQIGQIERIMRELRIAHLAQKYPHEISGGESQRVSLARAIAAESHLFLMDEPFSSIDSVFRRELRNDMLRFLRRKDRTTVIVTHDAEEALELADHILVLDHGRILQQGSPREIYFAPAELQVAQLFGEVNHLQDPRLVKSLTGLEREEAFVRPELFRLGAQDGIEGRVIHLAYRGNHSMISLVIEGERCLKIKTMRDDIKVGDRLRVSAIGEFPITA